MNRFVRLAGSSIGQKLLLALTGVVLGLFVLGHMSGNLLLFQGREAFNAYAAYLQHHPLLWVGRIGLACVVALHIAVAIRLWLANRAARGSRYAVEATVEASFASRHMLLSGLLVLAFVVYHLLHFTLGAIHPSHFGHHDDQGRHDVYRMVVLGFGQPAVAASYLAAMVVLGFHLIHGIRSLFETLGAHGAGLRAVVRSLALALVVLIVGGFCTVPLSILLGLVRLSDTGGGP